MSNRMHFLENLDKKDRTDGTPRLQKLRQIPPETGKFLALLAANCPQGDFIEIGTSAGYSTLWISLAAGLTSRNFKTFEILSEKITMARQTFKEAGVEDKIELIEGNALDYLDKMENIAFCFLDAEKDVYKACYEKISPKIISGGLLVADNAINHYEILKEMLDIALQDKSFDSMIIPIGKGELVCRKK